MTAKSLPDFFIGKSETNERVKKFRDQKYPLLCDAIGKQDTKAIWYSLKHIEDLYNELVYLNADGLRIYFGTYSDEHPDFANQTCLLMVPTRLNDETMGHKDSLLEDEPDFPERPGSELFIERSGTSVPFAKKDFNYGSPCPPVCPPEESDLSFPY